MKTIKSPLNVLLSAVAAFAAVWLATGANAATITWGAPTVCLNDTDVVNNGAGNYAYDWSTAQTVNGVSFTAVTSTTHASTNVGYNFTGTTANAYTSSGAPFSGL